MQGAIREEPSVGSPLASRPVTLTLQWLSRCVQAPPLPCPPGCSDRSSSETPESIPTHDLTHRDRHGLAAQSPRIEKRPCESPNHTPNALPHRRVSHARARWE